jgi:hypothetical protein
LSTDSEDRLEVDGDVIDQSELTAAETDTVSGTQNTESAAFDLQEADDAPNVDYSLFHDAWDQDGTFSLKVLDDDESHCYQAKAHKGANVMGRLPAFRDASP